MTSLFHVDNHMCEDCGTPPDFAIPADRSVWSSYFENRYGEQWVFQYCRKTKELTLRGGDCGWELPLTPMRVRAKELYDVATKDDKHSFLMQISFAGKTRTPVALLLPQPDVDQLLITACVDDRGRIMLTNLGESVWIDACIDASGYEPAMLTGAALLAALSVDPIGSKASRKDEDD